MSQQEFARLGKELEKLQGALQTALARIAALENKKDPQVPALLNTAIPAATQEKIDKRKKEWREKFRKGND